MPFERAVIVGAGPGFSAALARALYARGTRIALAARSPDKLAGLAADLGAATLRCDVADQESVSTLFGELDEGFGRPDLVVFNPSARQRGPFLELDPELVRAAVEVTAMGGFHVAREALARMVPAGRGALLFTGASASVKGYAQSAPFAMGKFALRGLAQSLAREMHPKGIHIVHVVIDGAIRNPGREEPADAPDSMLDPDAIAATCLAVLDQDRSAWTFEIEVRPWVERF